MSSIPLSNSFRLPPRTRVLRVLRGSPQDSGPSSDSGVSENVNRRERLPAARHAQTTAKRTTLPSGEIAGKAPITQPGPAIHENHRARAFLLSLKADGRGFDSVDATLYHAKDLGKSSNPFGTDSGTLNDELANLPPDLAEILSAWSSLDSATRRCVLAIIREAAKKD